MRQRDIQLVDLVVEWFARDPIGPLLTLPHVAANPPPELAAALEQQISLVPQSFADDAAEDPKFSHCFPEPADDERDRYARVWVILNALLHEIPRRRLEAFSRCPHALTSQPALEGVAFDDEGLVALDEFEMRSGLLIRHDHAFMIALPVGSTNATYWLAKALAATGAYKIARVRLDPLVHGPAYQFPAMEYRMWWWGEPLSWTELEQRTGFQAGAWQPGPLTHGIEHTEYAWHADDCEGHLELEELHDRDSNDTRGTRYLHAIYDRHEQVVVHVDGAVRILSDADWDQRRSRHLKDQAKIGTRVKIFRIDGQIPAEAMVAVSANYFVWNLDVQRFFGADIAPDL